MSKFNEISQQDSPFTTKIEKNVQGIEEFDINPDLDQKNEAELIKLFNENYMDQDEILSIFIRNDIALNLHLSLCKLKKGPNYQNLFKSPCQIKIYPKEKLMMIYLVVNHNFLRIKIELINIVDNKQLLNKNADSNSIKIKKEIEESPIININNKKKDEINKNEDNEKEIIFTLELIDLFNMLDLLLCENKEFPISFSINDNYSILTGKILCPDVFNQNMFSAQVKCNLLKNDVFLYNVSSPNLKEKQSKKNLANEGAKSRNTGEDSDGDNDDSSTSKNNNNKIENNNNINNDFENDYLENKFMIDQKCAKYIIEGIDLVDLYYFMKGLEYLYDDFSTHNIGISFTNEKGFFYCPAMERIHDGRYYENLSKNINQQMRINIKSVKDHFLTPFKYGFNSFYRTKFLSRFIMSFYNKDDKRLLIKVTPRGKMILAFTFSNPKKDLSVEQSNHNKNTLNKKSISEEINECIDDGDENDDYDNNENDNMGMDKIRRKNIIKDRLLDDENRGNIVEMIFYPVVFDICKS